MRKKKKVNYYQRDPASIPYIIARRGEVPNQIVEGDEYFIPAGYEEEVDNYERVLCKYNLNH